VEQFEGHVSHELASKSAAVQLDADGVGDDDTHGLRWRLTFLHQGGRSQVDVIVLQVSVKSDATAILVVLAERHQIEDLGEGGARSNWASLAGLQLSDVLGELGVHHGDLAVLDHNALQKEIKLVKFIFIFCLELTLMFLTSFLELLVMMTLAAIFSP